MSPSRHCLLARPLVRLLARPSRCPSVISCRLTLDKCLIPTTSWVPGPLHTMIRRRLRSPRCGSPRRTVHQPRFREVFRLSSRGKGRIPTASRVPGLLHTMSPRLLHTPLFGTSRHITQQPQFQEDSLLSPRRPRWRPGGLTSPWTGVQCLSEKSAGGRMSSGPWVLPPLQNRLRYALSPACPLWP